MAEKIVDEQERYVADASDGTVERFLRDVAIVTYGRLLRFSVSPDVWQALMYETAYGSVPGTRFATEHFELCTPDGWVPVLVGCYERRTGRAELMASMVKLDLASLLP